MSATSLLVILDGFGHSTDTANNAIAMADTAHLGRPLAESAAARLFPVLAAT